MRRLYALFVVVALVTGCGSDDESMACNPDVLAVTASVQIDGSDVCYLKGGLGFNSANNVISLNLFAPQGTTGEEIDVLFDVPAQGYQFNEAYTASSGEYDDVHQLATGSIILTEDNYPEDPNLLFFKGVIDLTFRDADSRNPIMVTGNFSFEKP